MTQSIIIHDTNDLGSINIDLSQDIIEIDRSKIGDTDEERNNYNLYALAKNNKNVKDLVIKLANNGFYITEHKKGTSTFTNYRNKEEFIKRGGLKNLKFDCNLFYSVEEPKINFGENKLLVIFSSVSNFPYNASIKTRNFFPIFKTISKYIPENTTILRIADIGGVVGSFYLNSQYDQKIESNIQFLIEKIQKNLSIKKENIVLYGASKGGTAATYHSIIGCYKCVAVDPIVSDIFHEETYNDPHFTNGGIFKLSKQELFSKALKDYKINSSINIIYSHNSPIYKDIEDIFKGTKINLIEVYHPHIKSHPDVGGKTINILLSMINGLFYNLHKIESKSVEGISYSAILNRVKLKTKIVTKQVLRKLNLI
ncbi:XcbB/CpsF family capsular polysaccharide biosynthesis protein [Vibrio lentus]|uniref:XcbB/CpsF family capsular polysaccharide biosynthesis protein n=1 Tax=Vibrio lentus TaxID=136468 RepID=A0A2N7C6K0_9VIBR|nr:XcbB/CpsF family capsular polysaccharide biosynthesis protein [Vibrio lentus]PME47028.1 hypothetical protein BCV34_18025 [Vibrio lentus]PME72411.1 hypothetical protein BCV30_21725 [Vibrio lentus]PME85307.1 hypothetical protein BCV27_09800 [Vibrio lentus]